MKRDALHWTGWRRRNLCYGETVMADILGHAPGPFYACRYGAAGGWSRHRTVRTAKQVTESWARRVAIPAIRNGTFEVDPPAPGPLYLVPCNGVESTDDDIPF